MEDLEAADVRTELRERIRGLFGGSGTSFEVVPFPGGAYEVPDEVGGGRPLLVVLLYEAVAIPAEPQGLPSEVEDSFCHKGADQNFREWQNNLVFVVADERLRENMKQKGQQAELTLTIFGGTPPYACRSGETTFQHAKTTQTVFQAAVRPPESSAHQIRVSDSQGAEKTALFDIVVDDVPPSELTAEGPLAQALTELWEKARKAKIPSVGKLIIRFYEAAAAWQVHQAVAVIRGDEVSCAFEAEIEAEGVELLRVEYAGNLAKAQSVRSFLEPQLRAADDHTFSASYTLDFAAPGMSLEGIEGEQMTKSLTRYGAGEAYVEAHAAPAGE